MAAMIGRYVEPSRGVVETRPFGDRPQGKTPERRSRRHPNPNRRSLYDLLFDEVDEIDGLTEAQKTKIKHNIRNYFGPGEDRGEPESIPPAAGHPPLGQSPDHADHEDAKPAATATSSAELAELLEVVVPTEGGIDAHQVVDMVLRPQAHTEDHTESEHIAQQMKLCLSLHTERARKIAVYLRALMILGGQDFRPHTIVEA